MSAFKITDEYFLAQNESIAKKIGSTANICMIVGDRILTVNLGDSRAVLSRNGMAIDLSVDHKPNMQIETERISRLGGFVTDNRLFGRLGVSRSFGDFEYKNY